MLGAGESHDRLGPAVRLAPDAFVLYSGGVRRTALELSRALRAQGANVSVSPQAEQRAARRLPAVTAYQRLRYQTHERCWKPNNEDVEGWISHSLYYDLLPPSRLPKVVTVHDFIHERFGSTGLLTRLKRRAIDHADCVVAVSAATAADVKEYFPNTQHVEVVHWGLSQPMLELPRSTVGRDRPYLLYVGPRSGYKNFALLVEALPLLAGHDLDLILVGGPPLSDSERRELALATGSGSRFTHLRPNDRELARLYDGAAALVVTSRYEGFGLPVLEAMARGCPVASSVGGSLREVTGGHAQLFDPDSLPGCVDAIDRALRLEATDREIAAQYAHGFTWESCGQRYLEIYRRLQSC